MITYEKVDQYEQRERARELGAVERGHLRVPGLRRDYYTGDPTHKTVTEVTHWFNEDGDEVCSTSTINPDYITVFDPPRKWAPEFKQNMSMNFA